MCRHISRACDRPGITRPRPCCRPGHEIYYPLRATQRGATMRFRGAVIAIILLVPALLQAQKPRERDLKLPIGGTPGPLDAITDVAGVEVGHTTLISGSGKLVVGQGPGAHRRHRRAPARQGQPRSGVRRLVHAERQRRDDRHDLGAGERAARRAGRDHQHAQRRRRARRDHPVGGRAEERAAAVVAAGRRRDLRRQRSTTSTAST